MTTVSHSISAPGAPSLLTADIRCDLDTISVLEIAGADAATFLQGQFSNDVRRVSPTTWQHTTFNSPKGRMLATLQLWADEGGYRALVASDIAEAVRKRLAMYVLRSKVTVADRSDMYVRIGIAGPYARELAREIFGEPVATGTVLRSGATCVLGLGDDRLLLIAPLQDGPAWRARLQPHTQSASPEVWTWLTLRAGVPVIARATQDLFVAQTANLDALGGLAFDKGCYTGQEIIARTQYLGRLKERMSVWHSDAHAAAPATRLYSAVFGDQACGTVVNAAPAPEGGIDLLAVVQTAAVEAGDVRLGTADGPSLVSLPLPYDLPQAAKPARPKL